MTQLAIQTQTMIDDLKNICAEYGLANTGSEYKIITEVFLYKFLNDKFLYEVRKKNPRLASLNFSEIEEELNKMSKEDFEEIYEGLGARTAKLKREHLLSALFNQQNTENFHQILDETLTEISDNNQKIFSAKAGDGSLIALFETISQEVENNQEKDDFCKALIGAISSFSFESAFSEKYDFFSTIFEYLIKDYNKDSGKYAEYYTPHTIATIIARILAPNGDKNVKIYDPSAGTGTLLLALAHQIGEDKCTLYSQDISKKSSELLRLNLVLNNLVSSLPNVIRDDTLLRPRHLNSDKNDLALFDYIVSNPPFNVDFSKNRDTLAGEAHRKRFFAGVPNKKESMEIYLMFIQHILYSLSSKGKGAIVVPTGFLTAGSGIPLEIRKHIVSNKMLRGVISMPSNVFATTGTNVSVIFLDKSQENDEILLMDASRLGITTKEGKNQRTVLQPEDIEKIVNTFNSKEKVKDFSIAVSYRDIEEKKYSFNAGQYFEIKINYTPITPQEFEAKLKDFTLDLDSLLCENSKLETEIRQSLKSLKYV